MKPKFLIAIALAAPIFSACDEEPLIPAAQTACPTGAALITVSDGYLETICGCAEPSPTYYGSGERLLCTVTAGTTVVFHYLATHGRHQILATGTPDFPPSPPSIPDDPYTMIRAHAVRLDATGTYSFDDGFDSSLAGDIVVL